MSDTETIAPVIYNYDAATRLYTGDGRADADPMQPGQWLLPANSTMVQPPIAQPGFAVVMSSNSADGWICVEDARGVWYNAQGQAVQIGHVQEDVSALTRTPPPSQDHELVQGKWQLSASKVSARFQLSKAGLLKQARDQREIVLNRLMGIAFSAEKAGNASTVAACMTARQSLLDLTKHATITGASTEAELKAAYKLLYGSIVAATPVDIRSVYADIQV